MNEKKINIMTIEDDRSKKQMRLALIVMAIFEAIVIAAFIIYKLSK